MTATVVNPESHLTRTRSPRYSWRLLKASSRHLPQHASRVISLYVDARQFTTASSSMPLTVLNNLLRRRVSVPYWLVVVSLTVFWISRRMWASPDLTVMAAARLAVMHGNYDSARDVEEWGMHIGDLDLNQYTADLKQAWTRLFGYSSTQPIPWSLLHSKLALDAVSDHDARIPHRVYTTSNLSPSSYPDQFHYWAVNDRR